MNFNKWQRPIKGTLDRRKPAVDFDSNHPVTHHHRNPRVPPCRFLRCISPAILSPKWNVLSFTSYDQTSARRGGIQLMQTQCCCRLTQQPPHSMNKSNPSMKQIPGRFSIMDPKLWKKIFGKLTTCVRRLSEISTDPGSFWNQSDAPFHRVSGHHQSFRRCEPPPHHAFVFVEANKAVGPNQPQMRRQKKLPQTVSLTVHQTNCSGIE